MIRCLALLPLLQPFVTVPMVRIERDLRYVRLAALSAIWGVAERIVTIVLMVELLRGHSYVFARIGGTALQAVLLFAVARWNPIALIGEVLRKGWAGRAHVRFGLTLQLKTLSDTIIAALIPGLGAKLFHPDLVGLMAWSHNVSFMVGQPLPQSVGRVVVGASHRFKRGGGELSTFSGSALLACTAVVGLALSILAATMPELLLHLFKPRWHGAAPYFAILCVVMAASVLHVFYDAGMGGSVRSAPDPGAGLAKAVSHGNGPTLLAPARGVRRIRTRGLPAQGRGGAGPREPDRLRYGAILRGRPSSGWRPLRPSSPRE
jgi:O-antigen/teichoic acid export membrane protein